MVIFKLKCNNLIYNEMIVLNTSYVCLHAFSLHRESPDPDPGRRTPHFRGGSVTKFLPHNIIQIVHHQFWENDPYVLKIIELWPIIRTSHYNQNRPNNILYGKLSKPHQSLEETHNYILSHRWAEMK
jgi:hypothetical protein